MSDAIETRNGAGTASLVLGIVMVVLGLLPIIWIAGVLGIIFGVIGRKRVREGLATNGTVATWGLVLSIVGTVVWGGLKFLAGWASV